MLIASVLLLFPFSCTGSEIAVLAPETNTTAKQFHESFESALKGSVPVADSGLGEAVLKTQNPHNPFNMTIFEARNLGTGIGCSYLVILKSDTIRRSAPGRTKYFESYAARYVVDARNGLLIDWDIARSEADAPEAAISGLLVLAPEAARDTLETISIHRDMQNRIPPPDFFEEKKLEKGARYPMPYKRLKPPYTDSANFYGVEATVDIMVEIDASGRVLRTAVTRWAGFGLDGSVERTVRAMQWRPADDKNGTFTMRVLLRYNFRDIKDGRK